MWWLRSAVSPMLIGGGISFQDLLATLVSGLKVKQLQTHLNWTHPNWSPTFGMGDCENWIFLQSIPLMFIFSYGGTGECRNMQRAAIPYLSQFDSLSLAKGRVERNRGVKLGVLIKRKCVGVWGIFCSIPADELTSWWVSEEKVWTAAPIPLSAEKSSCCPTLELQSISRIPLTGQRSRRDCLSLMQKFEHPCSNDALLYKLQISKHNLYWDISAHLKAQLLFI